MKSTVPVSIHLTTPAVASVVLTFTRTPEIWLQFFSVSRFTSPEYEYSAALDSQHTTRLVSLLQSHLEPTTAMARFRREERMPTLLHAMLCRSGLVMQKTSLTAECSSRPCSRY